MIMITGSYSNVNKDIYCSYDKNGHLVVSYLSNGLCCTSGSWDDVLSSSSTISPVLVGRSINSFLSSCCSMNSCHQTFNNSKVIVNDLCKWSQAIGGTTGVGYNFHVLFVTFFVDSHNKHRSISRWS